MRGVTINSHGPNNDGCDPESCRDVLIERCTFDTGDDCIAIKSGRNADGRRVNVPSENIIVRNCEMQRRARRRHDRQRDLRRRAERVRRAIASMDSPHLDRALRLKNNAMRGGVLEHIYMRDVTVGQVADSVLSIDFFYEEGDKGSFTPVARDVEMRDVTSKKSHVRALPARLRQRADREHPRHRLPLRQRREGERHRVRARARRSADTTINGVAAK